MISTRTRARFARAAALDACEALAAAYQRGAEDGGSVDWSDLDQAHALAVLALRLAAGRDA